MQEIKRVLMILHTPVNSIYGASKSFRAHYDLLHEKYDFDVLSQLSLRRKNQDLKYGEGVFLVLRNALGFTFRSRENIFTLFKLTFGIIYSPKLLAKVIKADIIHLNSLTLVLYAPLLKFLFPRKEIICHVREILTRYEYITNKCLNSADKIVCIDQTVRGYLSINDEDKVFVVSNPVIIKRENRQFNFDSENYVTIGVVGRLSKEKKTIEILEYIKSCRYKSEKPVMVYIVGGAGADTSYYNNCRIFMESLPNVHYLGEVDNLENTNFYEQLDCLLRFDDHYSVGRTILEAVNFGVNIYTEKDVSKMLRTEMVYCSSRFFSLENNKSFFFEQKDRAGDVNNRQFTEHTNTVYINSFSEKIYG